MIMAKIKVKLRHSSVAGKAGTLYYQVCHRSRVAQITTRLKLLPEQWNAETEQVADTGDETLSEYLRTVARQVASDVDTLHRIIDSLESRSAAYSVRDIVNSYCDPGKRVIITDYMQAQIDLLIARNRLGTARNYKRALDSLSRFLNGVELPLSSFDERVVCDYEIWLQRRGIKRNSVSFYMRVLRAVYNQAVRQHLVEQTFPFQNVYTGVDHTRKRAVAEDIVKRLRRADLDRWPSLSFARDLFIFSFCMRGMAFVDMAYLRKCDIKDDTIWYVRRKTGCHMAVRVEPCMREIIGRYEAYTAGSPYVFPILRSLGPLDAYREYNTALGSYNQRLKKLSGLLGLTVKLTSYTSRHTWATTARNHNIPISVISAGMGHSSERTTQIYLSMLENSVVDNANQHLIAALNM